MRETAEQALCFHCALPVGSAPYRVRVGEAWKPVCCAGCEAVANVILGQGLQDYYRLRERPAAGPGPEDPDAALYDDPALQQRFVRSVGREKEASLLVEGIRCAACAWLIEQTLARRPGVCSARINYATHGASVRWDPARIALSEILGAVAKVGYRASPFDAGRAQLLERRERRDALWRLFVAGFGMMQVMMYALPAYLAQPGDMTADIGQLMRWASFVLTVPVVFYSASPFFTGAWRALVSRRLDMNVPVALGVALAFGASVIATLSGAREVYYDSVAMFVFALLLGRFLELLARQRAAGSLRHLGRLTAQFASRLGDGGSIERVPAALLCPGERVLVKPGESFPADGAVESGSGAADESLISGESRPVPKAPGSHLLGGAVNLADPLVMKVERVGADTALSSVLRLVEQASSEKPRIVELADRSASVFVLMVLVLAGLAGAYWFAVDTPRALLVAVSVLVATCPCALSLATPAALTAATGQLARRGVILARRHAIEALAGATDFVFDKTGTLTRGELRVAAVRPCGSHSANHCLELAAAIESASEHPVAKAFLDAAPNTGFRATGARNFPGLGVDALVGGERYRLGSEAFVRAPSSEAAGTASVVWLADSRGPIAAFQLADEPRPEAASVVAQLQQAGLATHLLSGDAMAATRRAAEQAGIDKVRAAASPQDKLDYLRALQRSGRKVAMVGDGINDAPVLALADVSFGMGTGTVLSQSRADAVLLRGLNELPRALRYARLCMRIVRQNIAWAFAYNALVLPLALSGALTPWAAAAGMSMSSLVVVLNALRLQRAA